ncbi:hypothetical protein VPHK453_0032 [Vibrio phage K453]
MLLLPYLNVLIRYALRFGLSFLTAWITTCTRDTTLSMTMESQLNGLEWLAGSDIESGGRTNQTASVLELTFPI